jgi:hypothetical protein
MSHVSLPKSRAIIEVILQMNADVLDALIAQRENGYTLPAPFYLSPAIFEADVARILGRYWIFVGVEPEIPKPGQFVARAHQGIASPAYQPGPYSPFTEDLVDTFCNWYLRHLQASDGNNTDIPS